VLVRLNQTYAPDSSFSVYAYPNLDYKSTPVGYDVAICVEEFKPYMIDAYNNVSHYPLLFTGEGNTCKLIILVELVHEWDRAAWVQEA
jgi:hypothetical protein